MEGKAQINRKVSKSTRARKIPTFGAKIEIGTFHKWQILLHNKIIYILINKSVKFQLAPAIPNTARVQKTAKNGHF